jgi:predicted transcriptional regulator
MADQNKPTPAELEILSVLWERKQASVREVFEAISEQKATTYTTVLKFMQIMQQKGLVVRDITAKAHIYRPRQTKQQTLTNLVGDLLQRAFRGSALNLVQHVLETKPASRSDLDAIRQMIDEAEAKGAGR